MGPAARLGSTTPDIYVTIFFCLLRMRSAENMWWSEGFDLEFIPTGKYRTRTPCDCKKLTHNDGIHRHTFQQQIYKIPYSLGVSVSDSRRALDMYEAHRQAGKVIHLPPRPLSPPPAPTGVVPLVNPWPDAQGFVVYRGTKPGPYKNWWLHDLSFMYHNTLTVLLSGTNAVNISSTVSTPSMPPHRHSQRQCFYTPKLSCAAALSSWIHSSEWPLFVTCYVMVVVVICLLNMKVFGPPR